MEPISQNQDNIFSTWEALREDDMEAKKDGGTVDWEYLLSRVESF